MGFGVLSIARILPFGLVLTGTLFLAPFLVFPTSQEVRVEERKSISLMQPLIWLTIAVFILLMTSSYSLSIATADAREALTEAPQARVEFASSSLHKSILQDIEDSDEPSKQWTFGVVYLGTNFAYLKSINPEVGSSGAHIYAVPIEDIVSISYVRKVEAK